MGELPDSACLAPFLVLVHRGALRLSPSLTEVPPSNIGMSEAVEEWELVKILRRSTVNESSVN